MQSYRSLLGDMNPNLTNLCKLTWGDEETKLPHVLNSEPPSPAAGLEPEKTICVEDGQRDLPIVVVSSILGSLNLATRCIRSHHRSQP